MIADAVETCRVLRLFLKIVTYLLLSRTSLLVHILNLNCELKLKMN